MINKTIILISILMTGFSATGVTQPKPFVPFDFKVPETLETTHFRARMLTINDVVKDYDAVMTSIDHLKGVFGPKSDWPSKELTIEQDLIDLGWHQKEFQIRRSFAYTIVSLDETEVIGCLYINPTAKADYDASIIMWVRTSMQHKGLDSLLFNTVKQWIKKDWPFKNVAYPSRAITWEVWDKMKYK